MQLERYGKKTKGMMLDMCYIMPEGIINVYKPKGMTSFDVIAVLRKILRMRKIGHTGTLDKEVEGVLPVCVGTATGAVPFLTVKDKVYQCEMQFGVVTDTQDAYGAVIAAQEIEDIRLHETQLRKIVSGFVGEYMQIPPMYSAKKVNGERLYNIARQGGEVERKPVQVQILYIRDIAFLDESRISFVVKCSKGTYIRTLCHDIGSAYGTGAHMTELKRIQSGTFHIADAVCLEEIQAHVDAGTIGEIMTPVEQALVQFPKLELGAEELRLYQNGMTVRFDCDAEAELYRVYDQESGVFIGVGERRENGFIKTKKFFCKRETSK